MIQKEESRAGNSCCGEEQMALGGVVMAAVPGHPPHGWADQNNCVYTKKHSQPF